MSGLLVRTHIASRTIHSLGHFYLVSCILELSPGVDLAFFFPLCLFQASLSRDCLGKRFLFLLVDPGFSRKVGRFAHQKNGKDDLNLQTNPREGSMSAMWDADDGVEGHVRLASMSVFGSCCRE